MWRDILNVGRGNKIGLGADEKRMYVVDAKEEVLNGSRQSGRRRYQIVNSIKIDGNYEKTERIAGNRRRGRLPYEVKP